MGHHHVSRLRDGPGQQYSLILADWWACGWVMGYHNAEEDLVALAKEPSNNDSRARPSLSTVKVGGESKRRLEANEGPVNEMPLLGH